MDTHLLTIDNFAFDTSAFAIKLSSCNAIFAFSRNLRKDFYPYVAVTVPKILDLFTFHSKVISQKALKIVRNLVIACQNQTEIAEVLATCLPYLLKAIKINSAKENGKD